MKLKRNVTKTLALVAGVLAAEMAMVSAAPITGVTYVYDNLGELGGMSGKDVPSGINQALTDGLGQADEYIPSDYFWSSGQEGVIYRHVTGDVGIKAQPRVTFDLGSSFDLSDVTIHYGLRTNSGIYAPASVDVTIDGSPVGNFSGFNNAANVRDFGDIRQKRIDLTGHTGRHVTLELRGNPADAGSDLWLGLTEVEFNGDPDNQDDPNLQVSRSIDLGSVVKSPASTAHSFMIINTGATNLLNVTGITFSGPDASSFTAGVLPTGIAADGGTGAVNFTFDSGGVAGTYHATANIESNDVSNPVITTDLTIVVEDPKLNAPAAVSFGTIFAETGLRTGSFAISNSAQLIDLTITGASFNNVSGGASWSVGLFSSSIAAGTSSNLTFTFDTEVAPGVYTADLEIASNDPELNPAVVPIEINVAPLRGYQRAVFNDSPVLYWSFDEVGINDNAVEIMSGKTTNTLVRNGSATRVVSDIGLGNAADFNGVNGNRFRANGLSTAQTSYEHYAVEYWVRLDNTTKASYQIEGTAVGLGNSPALIYGFNSNLEAFFAAKGRTGNAGPTALSDHAWHHIVTEIDTQANTHSIYVDGIFSGTYSGAISWGLASLNVGTDQSGANGTDGQIDELAFYDLANGLTGQEIANHFWALNGLDYDDWLVDNGKTDSPDNLKEYAFGTTEIGAISLTEGGLITLGQAPAMQIISADGDVSVGTIFGRRWNHEAAGLTYTIEFSTDLNTWYSSSDLNLRYAPGSNQTPVVIGVSGEMDVVRVAYPLFIKINDEYVRTRQGFCRIGVSVSSN